MKIIKIIPLSFAFALSLTVISCGEKEEDKDQSTDKTTSSAPETHVGIAENISTILTEMMDELAGIKDVPSANEFSVKMDGYVDSLKDLLAKAKELPAPTEEQKSAVQKVKDVSDDKAEKVMMGMGEAMANNPDAKAIGEVIGKVMQNEEMRNTMDEFQKLYDLEE